MHGQAQNHFKEDRPFALPEAAARKLLDLIGKEIDAIKQPHAYTGAINSAFTRGGGNIAEYAGGRDFGIAQGWFEIDGSGTRIKPLAP